MADVLAGTVDAALLAEFGELELWTATATVARAATAAGHARLGRLSGSFHAAERIRERAGRLLDPAYPAFERQTGLDATVPPTALERDAREVVVTGALRADHAVDAARLAVLAEVGVPLMALDAGRTDGPWRLTATAGEPYRDGTGSAPGDLVVADAVGPVAPVVGDPPGRLVAGAKARTVLLYAVRVPGVASWEVSEAVWRAVHYLAAT
ncbi:hypothetical protein [Actinomycetospora termitidis]|uniref:Uncharacterized protein n=1 Tax=Actinomycetospora termitidis TaxID=3053470 RepID=A0ABT7M3H6_9PSEU|nr:hypothetical protein [Actinomycetospora sp. Odt1-22]MDL5154976.1 hypothetical protein [Actinomycetospora sp. Odt1-22]